MDVKVLLCLKLAGRGCEGAVVSRAVGGGCEVAVVSRYSR